MTGPRPPSAQGNEVESVDPDASRVQGCAKPPRPPRDSGGGSQRHAEVTQRQVSRTFMPGTQNSACGVRVPCRQQGSVCSLTGHTSSGLQTG